MKSQEDAPVTLYCSEEHTSQAVLDKTLYLPAGQRRQEELPALGLYMPAAHEEQEAVAVAYVPAGQDADVKSQEAAPAVLYALSGHACGRAEPARQKEPAGHIIGYGAPVGQKEPAGQPSDLIE